MLEFDREPKTQKITPPTVLVRVVVITMMLVVFALYVYSLGKQSLWFDEGLSVAFAAKPLPQLMQTLIYADLHPPLYYLLLHFWMSLAGKSELAVRMPSAIAAILLVLLTFAVAAEVWGQARRASAGIAAAALVASSPFIAYYAQEARMYSLAATFTLATTWAFLRATRSTGRRWWLTFSCLLAASLYTLYLSAWIVPALAFYVLLFNRKYLLRTVGYTLFTGILYLPWAVPAYLQLGRLLQMPDYWVTTRIHPLWFLRTLWDALLPSAQTRWSLLIGVCGSLLLVLLVVHRGPTLTERERRAALVFLTFLIPLILTYATVRLAPKFVPRYTIGTVAPLYISITFALYIAFGKKPISQALLSLLIIGVVGLSLRSTFAVVEGRENPRDDARGLATYLTQNATADDALLLVEDAPYALQYYYLGNARWYGVHVGQDFDTAADALNGMLRSRPRRVWLILWHHEFADPTDMVVTELLRVGQEVDLPRQFRGYWLRAFDIQNYEQVIAPTPKPEKTTDADFASGLRLIGFDRLDNARGQLHYVLYWQAQQPLQRNYSLTLRFQDTAGNEYLRKDQALSTPYFLPPVWPVETPIRGRVDVTLLADMPPLTYRVSLKVLDPTSQRNLDLIDKHGIALGQALLLEELLLSKADLSSNHIQVKNPLQADMGDGLQLLGFDLQDGKYSQGDTVQLTLWWQSLSKSSKDHLARFRLLDINHRVAWEDTRPILLEHPTSHWQPGEINRAIYRLAIPSNLPAGDYSLQAGTENRTISLTQVHITSREHRYQVPPMQQASGVRFEQDITLLGYDLQAPVVQPEKPITITLYWQPAQTIPISYKVSVQVLSADRRIVAQEDSIPVRWTYPTTAWLPGEVITDEHVLTINPDTAPGDYTLIVALYEERSGQRLLVSEEGKVLSETQEKPSDHISLTTLRVLP